MNIYTFRLKPGQDLKTCIEQFTLDKQLRGASILSCVGGLTQVTMRMAGATPDKQDIRTTKEHLEIVSLVGTICGDGTHLHIAVSDKNGAVTGGHLKEGTLVYPTAEVVIISNEHETYRRIMDKDTGFPELIVETT